MAWQTTVRGKVRLAEAIRSAAALFRLPEHEPVSVWADRERVLSPERSSEPGRYSTERTPYAREIMDCFSNPGIQEVVVMSSSQVGKTTILENVIAYAIDRDPRPILVVMPTLDMAEAFSRDGLAPMFRDTAAVRRKTELAGSKKGGNTLLYKKFLGGHVSLTGSNSASGLASRPIGLLLCDEVDRYELSAGTEGDPVRLAVKRTATFWDAKIGYFSTPGNRGASRIAELFEDSDQRKFWVPCPKCAAEIVLTWASLKWAEGSPAADEDGREVRRAVDAWFECAECGARIGDVARWEAIRRGRWVASRPLGEHRRAGFFLWQGYSPWRTAIQTANEWLSALGRPDQEKTVINTVRGETYAESGEVPDWERLIGRCEKYTLGTVPGNALFLTAGADVQKDRIEVSVWGWGRGRERWLVDHRVLTGSPSEPGSWQALGSLLSDTWPHDSGFEIGVALLAVDAGYETTHVYDFCRQHGAARVVPILGRDWGQALVWQAGAIDYRRGDGKAVKRGARPWILNTSKAKEELYGVLAARRPESGASPPGWVHFPEGVGEEWFRQLASEQRILRRPTSKKTGFSAYRWEWAKLRERNEALDCANYARAAAAILGIDQFGERHWRSYEQVLNKGVGVLPDKVGTEVFEPLLQPTPPPRPQRRVESWLGMEGGAWL